MKSFRRPGPRARNRRDGEVLVSHLLRSRRPRDGAFPATDKNHQSQCIGEHYRAVLKRHHSREGVQWSWDGDNCEPSCHCSASAYNGGLLSIPKNGLAPPSHDDTSGTMIDTRFSTALHIMATVAINQERAKRTTSQSLASSLGANASFVRKLLGPLGDAGLLKVNTGGRGGIFLTRPSSSILISDIYNAAAPEKKIWETRNNLPCICLVSRNIVSLSDLLLDEAQRGMLESLSEWSLNCVVEKLKGFEDKTSSAKQQH